VFSNGKSKRNAGSPVKLDVRFEMKQLGSFQIAGHYRELCLAASIVPPRDNKHHLVRDLPGTNSSRAKFAVGESAGDGRCLEIQME
jgi:hypothetical protein